MEKSYLNISNKTVAVHGAIVAVAATFGYSIMVMIYVIVRTSATTYSIIPEGERCSAILANGFSVAYSIAVFSILMAILSAMAGSVAGIILRKLLLHFNRQFNLRKAFLISCISAFALLILFYLLLYTLLKDWMTFDYAETLSFWFLFPALIFFAGYIVGGSRLNKILNTP